MSSCAATILLPGFHNFTTHADNLLASDVATALPAVRLADLANLKPEER